GHGRSLARILSDLTGGTKKLVSDKAHLDPDLRASSVTRPHGWRPLFGQDGAAQRHLERHGVGVNDLFLFFGGFRETELCAGRLRYVAGGADLDLIFGWVRVGEVWRVCDCGELPAYARSHPHAVANDFGPTNTIYAAVRRGSSRAWDAGVFARFDARL